MKEKIAVTATGNTLDSQLEPRFGRAAWFMVYDSETSTWTPLDNRHTATSAHGAGTETAQAIHDAGVGIVITGNGPGGNAARMLKMAGIQVYLATGNVSVKQALEQYLQGGSQLFEM